MHFFFLQLVTKVQLKLQENLIQYSKLRHNVNRVYKQDKQNKHGS